MALAFTNPMAKPADNPAAMSPPSQDLCDISIAHKYIDTLIANNTNVERKVNEAREKRAAFANVDEMKRQGRLQANETYLAVRLIDQNIRTSQPNWVSYLTQPPRIAVCVPQDAVARTLNIDFLEMELTRVLRYPEYEVPFIRIGDGAELHGNDVMAVLFDDTKPGHVAFEHISHEELMYDQNIDNIQYAPMILWSHYVTPVNFAAMRTTFGFEEALSKRILDELSKDQTTQNRTRIFRCFFKKDGVVHDGWYWKHESAEWLRKPQEFYNGLDRQEMVMPAPVPGQIPSAQPVPQWIPMAMNEYPFYVMRYYITEIHRLDCDLGRADTEHYMQEAATSMLSAGINGCWQASIPMWAPLNPPADSEGTAPKQLKMPLARNAIWDQPMQHFHAEWPDMMIFKALEVIQQANATQNNQVAWAVNNRQDTRKTAKEIEAAAGQQSFINSLQTAMRSTFMLKVVNAAWNIVRNRALSGKLTPFCAVANPDGSSGANDVQLIGAKIQLRPAGDVDFVQREQMITSMQQDWPMIQQTPIAPLFMMDYLQARYPDQAGRYKLAFQQAMQAQQAQQQNTDAAKDKFIVSLGETIHHLVTDEHGQLKPEFASQRADLTKIANGVASVARGSGANNGAGAPAMAGASGNAANGHVAPAARGAVG